MMQAVRLYVENILKSSKIVIFVDDLKITDLNSHKENVRINSDLTDLLRVYQLSDRHITVKQISELKASLDCKAYLNTLCRRNKKIVYPLIFINEKYFGSYLDLNRAHEEGYLFQILKDNGLVKADHSSLLFEDSLQKSLQKSTDYSFSSSYSEDNDLNAITDVTISNIELGKSISQTIMEANGSKFKFNKNYNDKFNVSNNNIKIKANKQQQQQQQQHSSNRTSMAIKGTEESQITWADTVDSYSTIDTNLKFNYCLNYIQNISTTAQNKRISQQKQVQAKQTDNQNSQLSNTFDLSRKGPTPPVEVLSVIRGRLCRADAAIQSKSMNILSRKLQTSEF